MFPISDQSAQGNRLPYVNIALIAISAIVFFFELGLDNLGEAQFFHRWGLIPRELTNSNFDLTHLSVPFVGPIGIQTPGSNYLTLVTSMFVHGSVLHFAGNMIFLWVFGDNVEAKLGHWWYLAFYLVTGVAAAGAQIATNLDSVTPTIGASGAIAGVQGAYFLLYPYNRVRSIVVFLFFFPIVLPAVYLIGFWIILQFFNGFLALDSSVTSGVAYWAHIGGFTTGLLIIAFLKLFAWQEPFWPPRSTSPLRLYGLDGDPYTIWRGR